MSLLTPFLLGLALPGAQADDDSGRGYVALQAGTIHLVEAGEVLTGGATVLVHNGEILAVGSSVDIPADAEVVDYGEDAVIVPGLVAAFSGLANGIPSPRTAEPGLDALDGFDMWSRQSSALAGGVTSAYIAPAQSRLVAGHGALVKLSGDDHDDRVLSAPAAIDGSITAAARNVQDFWAPPIPPTVDVGMGGAIPQLPRTTMGAVVALGELVEAAKTGEANEHYGPYAAGDLAELMGQHVPWAIDADTEGEIRALIDFANAEQLPLIVRGGLEAGELAEELAMAGAGVVYRMPYGGGSTGTNRGKGEDALWPDYGQVVELVRAGVPVAVSTNGSPRSLRFAAALASRGGLDHGAALRTITLGPAEMFGAAARVGSIAPGKDADLVVLNGAPLDSTSSVVATWVDGELAWKSGSSSTTVIEVDELHVGDGEVMSPGQMLLRGGKIVEVGRSVAHPAGATVVRAPVAMPGVVDAMGQLGLEGSRRIPASDFSLGGIVEPGDATDRRVARNGVTTVLMTPPGPSGSGAPILAYKPAADSFGGLVISDPAALRVQWSDPNRTNAGNAVRSLLERAKKYDRDWDQYEAAMAAWTPPNTPRPRPAANVPAEEDDDEDEDDDDEDDDDDEEEENPDPYTGIWAGSASRGEDEAATSDSMRLQFQNVDGELSGNLRSSVAGDALVSVSGEIDDEGAVHLHGLGTAGDVRFTAEVEEPERERRRSRRSRDDDDDEDEDGEDEDEEEPAEPVAKLVGTLTVGGVEYAVSLDQQSAEYLSASRPVRRRQAAQEQETPEGMPRAPKHDPKLEPLRRAMSGQATVIVHVDRDDEILDCVAAFENAGIRPVLYGASGATIVSGQLRGRVSGVLTNSLSTRASLQQAGVPVAFYSNAEEGAADLLVIGAYAVTQGMSPQGALRALTADAADMFGIGDRVGRLRAGLDADVLLLDGSPLSANTSVLRAYVNGSEVLEGDN